MDSEKLDPEWREHRRGVEHAVLAAVCVLLASGANTFAPASSYAGAATLVQVLVLVVAPVFCLVLGWFTGRAARSSAWLFLPALSFFVPFPLDGATLLSRGAPPSLSLRLAGPAALQDALFGAGVLLSRAAPPRPMAAGPRCSQCGCSHADLPPASRCPECGHDAAPAE